MPRAGRDLEVTAALFERLLANTNVEIRSPDYIRGVHSGSHREVDISLRARVGSSEVLIVAECRDRADTEDVRWIEQLASKAEDVEASKIVAVSSRGFSRGARKAATARNIELRTVDELDQEVVLHWFPSSHLSVLRRLGELRAVGLQPTSYQENLAVAKKAIAEISDPSQRALAHTGTGNHISLLDAWQEILNQNPQLFDGLGIDETRPVTVLALYDNPEGRYALRAGDQLVHIARMTFTAELSIAEIRGSGRVVQYTDDAGNPIAQSVNFEMTAQGRPVTIGFHRTGPDSEIYVTVRQDPPAGGSTHEDSQGSTSGDMCR